MLYNSDPIDLKGKTFEEVMVIARRMYMLSGPTSPYFQGIETSAKLADKLEADALSIARWETDAEGFFKVPACVSCGRLLEFAHHVRAL